MLNPQAQLLENAFFHKRDAELIAELRRREAAQSKMRTLAEVSGITDEGVLSQLIAHDIHAEALAAFSLVPVLEVVWSDGEVQPAERSALLQAIDKAGIPKESPSYQLLDRWLQQPPEPKLMGIWKDYTLTLLGQLTPEARERVKQTVLQHARTVAEAAGGFLGFGRISDKEQEMLKVLEETFNISGKETFPAFST